MTVRNGSSRGTRVFTNRAVRWTAGVLPAAMVLISFAGIGSGVVNVESAYYLLGGAVLGWRIWATTRVVVHDDRIVRSRFFRRLTTPICDVQHVSCRPLRPDKDPTVLLCLVLHLRSGGVVEVRDLTARGRRAANEVAAATAAISQLIARERRAGLRNSD